jgi:hypothetical protein
MRRTKTEWLIKDGMIPSLEGSSWRLLDAPHS